MSSHGKRRLTLAEALRHFRNHATATPSTPVAVKKPAEDPAFLATLSVVLQEREVLEASLKRVRPQREPRGGAKKLQSAYPLAVEGATDTFRGSVNTPHGLLDDDGGVLLCPVPGNAEGPAALSPHNTDIYVPVRRRPPYSMLCDLVVTTHDVAGHLGPHKLSLDPDHIMPNVARRLRSPQASFNLHDTTVATLEDH